VAVRAVRDIDDVVIVGRDADRAASLASRVGARVGSVADIASADVVVCATTAVEPIFDGALVGSDTLVVAVGSHLPDARELDTSLMRRSHVVVEDRATALREAGDVVLAGLGAADLLTLAEVVTGTAVLKPGRPCVYKSVGMAWQDLVTAAAVVVRDRPADDVAP
jgi:ornithine cyclodeaminase